MAEAGAVAALNEDGCAFAIRSARAACAPYLGGRPWAIASTARPRCRELAMSDGGASHGGKPLALPALQAGDRSTMILLARRTRERSHLCSGTTRSRRAPRALAWCRPSRELWHRSASALRSARPDGAHGCPTPTACVPAWPAHRGWQARVRASNASRSSVYPASQVLFL